MAKYRPLFVKISSYSVTFEHIIKLLPSSDRLKDVMYRLKQFLVEMGLRKAPAAPILLVAARKSPPTSPDMAMTFRGG